MKYRTKQEQFWARGFGDSYIERNKENELLSSHVALFGEIISKNRDVKSAIKFGANIGLNLEAIEQLDKQIELSAVEINKKAVRV